MPDLSGTPVDQTKYRSIYGSQSHEPNSNRPDIGTCIRYCARYQQNRLRNTLTAVKWIFRYLKDSINMGLWYPKDTGLDSRKSTSGGIQFLGGDKIVSWSSKKQDCTLMSSAEAEYVL
ncbi:hypothetical protein Tco_1229484 [Tanacetum coccineum]